MNKESVIPTVQVPSVSREETDPEVPSSSRKSLLSKTTEQLPFLILDEMSKYFRKFNTFGRSMVISKNLRLTLRNAIQH